MTATINSIPVRQARLMAEMTNATNLNTATMTAYVLRSSAGHFLDRVEPVEVTAELRPGWSSRDHLFDVLAEAIVDRVDGRLFASEAALAKAARNVTTSRCDASYTVALALSYTSRDVPAELESDAEAIRAAARAKQARKDAAAVRKQFAALQLEPVQRAGGWVIIDRSKPEVDPNYTFHFNFQPGNHYCGRRNPGESFASREEAAARIAAYAASIGA